jgi:hypothetical protein
LEADKRYGSYNNKEQTIMNRNNWMKAGAFVIALIVVWFAFTGSSNNLPKDLEGKWQAVFLTDGQVYFGRLENYNRSYASLKDVYYLKLASDLQSSSSNLNLIRLGGEAHGPESEMFISKDKISFIENLKDTSTVVQAIRNNLK